MPNDTMTSDPTDPNPDVSADPTDPNPEVSTTPPVEQTPPPAPAPEPTQDMISAKDEIGLYIKALRNLLNRLPGELQNEAHALVSKIQQLL